MTEKKTTTKTMTREKWARSRSFLFMNGERVKDVKKTWWGINMYIEEFAYGDSSQALPFNTQHHTHYTCWAMESLYFIHRKSKGKEVNLIIISSFCNSIILTLLLLLLLLLCRIVKEILTNNFLSILDTLRFFNIWDVFQRVFSSILIYFLFPPQFTH